MFVGLTMQATSYLDNMAASTEQVVSNKEGIVQAEKGRLIAQKRYEVGKGTILELNDSEVALTQAQLTYNQIGRASCRERVCQYV